MTTPLELLPRVGDESFDFFVGCFEIVQGFKTNEQYVGDPPIIRKNLIDCHPLSKQRTHP